MTDRELFIDAVKKLPEHMPLSEIVRELQKLSALNLGETAFPPKKLGS